jgi:hypothetical protein
MKEHDCKPDKSGNRGSDYGHGKMRTTPEGFSDSDIKAGGKKMGNPSLTDGGRVKK